MQTKYITGGCKYVDISSTESFRPALHLLICVATVAASCVICSGSLAGRFTPPLPNLCSRRVPPAYMPSTLAFSAAVGMSGLGSGGVSSH